MSIGVLDVIDRLPFELKARLEADDFFVDVPVIVAEEGNIRAMLAEKQAVMTQKGGKIGAAVIVLQLEADDEMANVAFGSLTLRPSFQVYENLELNRGVTGTGKSARRIARRIRDVIKPLALYGLCTEFIPEKPCIVPVQFKDQPALVKGYQIGFRTYEADNEGMSMCALPQVVDADTGTPQFAITCDTVGADVWFTLDESYPGPANPAAKAYSSPVDIPAEGVYVRAAAYRSGYVASQVQRVLAEAAWT